MASEKNDRENLKENKGVRERVKDIKQTEAILKRTRKEEIHYEIR